MMDKIRPGDRVKIALPRGGEAWGRVVMLGSYGWVLNMGGRYGIPAIASEENILDHRKAKGARPGRRAIA